MVSSCSFGLTAGVQVVFHVSGGGIAFTIWFM